MTPGVSRVLLRAERILPSVLLAALLLFQLTHLSVERVRSRVPLRSGIYAIQEWDRPFLPGSEEMKRLALQIGLRDGFTLGDENVDVRLVLDILRVNIRADVTEDWGRFFADYQEGLRRVALARWEKTRLMHAGTCVSPPSITFEGWSSSHESWIKPLDFAALGALTIGLVMSIAGGRPTRTR